MRRTLDGPSAQGPSRSLVGEVETVHGEGENVSYVGAGSVWEEEVEMVVVVAIIVEDGGMGFCDHGLGGGDVLGDVLGTAAGWVDVETLR